jgi:copper(I)-binding protein
MVTKSDGTMGKNLVTDPVVVPAGGQLELAEGGLHVMCIQMKPDLFKPGAQISLTLTFEMSGDKRVMADIREAAAMPTGMAMGTLCRARVWPALSSAVPMAILPS